MKLIFLCGSLEKGSCGVGDYSQSLASELIRLGHSVICIALNDKYITVDNCCSSISPVQQSQDALIYRFSQKTNWIKKLSCVREIIKLSNPDWVSIQYVIFSYGSNGLAFQFTFLSFLLRGGWKIHIMFHEIWIEGVNLKRWIVSQLQRYLIKTLVLILRPSLVTTSIDHYATMLAKLNISSSILRLHGNIPVHPIPPIPSAPSQQWIFIFFGSLDKKWQAEPLFSYIESARISSGIVQCLFLKLGRPSVASSIIWDQISSASVQYRYPAFKFVDRGEQSEVILSGWLSKATFGISMSPLQWIGKSGSVATMIDHGLPVIVPEYNVPIDKPPLNSFPYADQLFLIDSSLPSRLQQVPKFPVNNSVIQTAARQLDLFTC